MRFFIALLTLTTPAHAWEFTTGLPCLLTHETAQARIELTYDPTQPLYSVTIRRDEAWPETPFFEMAFLGPQGRRIGTDRHVLSDDGRALTATDTGFGNVLDGLQYNHTATAIAGGITVTIPLDGAAGPVADFRACDPTPPTS